jgi:hypothetical protein
VCDTPDPVRTLVHAPLELTRTAVSSVGKMFKKPELPDVVRQAPLDDQAASDTKAAQEGQRAVIEAGRRRRKNSLLSVAGGVGDQSAPELATSSARPVGY